jgi:hypothetical protein
MDPTTLIYHYPMHLQQIRKRCIFCRGNSINLEVYPLRVDPTRGWIVCNNDHCKTSLFYCQNYYNRQINTVKARNERVILPF